MKISVESAHALLARLEDVWGGQISLNDIQFIMEAIRHRQAVVVCKDGFYFLPRVKISKILPGK